MFQSISPFDVLVAIFVIGASACIAFSILLIAYPDKLFRKKDKKPVDEFMEHSFQVWHTGGLNPCQGLAWTWIQHPFVAGGGPKNAILPNGTHPNGKDKPVCGTCGRPMVGHLPVTIKMIPKIEVPK